MDSVHAQCICRMHICLEVVEKRRAGRGRVQPFHREFIDSRVWFANADFVAVDDGVKNRSKIHEGPPPLAKFENIVREDADGNLCILQVVDERDHVLIQLKIEW